MRETGLEWRSKRREETGVLPAGSGYVLKAHYVVSRKRFQERREILAGRFSGWIKLTNTSLYGFTLFMSASPF